MGSQVQTSTYTVKALTMFLHTSTLISSFWNRSTNGRNLSCRKHDITVNGCDLSKLKPTTNHGEEGGKVCHVRDDLVHNGHEVGIV